MSDEKPKNAPDADGPEGDRETPQISLPSREPLPPPPEINYTRPTLPAGLSARPALRSGVSQGDADGSSEVSGHGAGMAAGITFGVSIIAGAIAGNWMDVHWIHAQVPWATLVMTLLGAVAGFTNMMRLLSRSDRNRK